MLTLQKAARRRPQPALCKKPEAAPRQRLRGVGRRGRGFVRAEDAGGAGALGARPRHHRRAARGRFVECGVCTPLHRRPCLYPKHIYLPGFYLPLVSDSGGLPYTGYWTRLSPAEAKSERARRGYRGRPIDAVRGVDRARDAGVDAGVAEVHAIDAFTTPGSRSSSESERPWPCRRAVRPFRLPPPRPTTGPRGTHVGPTSGGGGGPASSWSPSAPPPVPVK